MRPKEHAENREALQEMVEDLGKRVADGSSDDAKLMKNLLEEVIDMAKWIQGPDPEHGEEPEYGGLMNIDGAEAALHEVHDMLETLQDKNPENSPAQVTARQAQENIDARICEMRDNIRRGNDAINQILNENHKPITGEAKKLSRKRQVA
jgi:hypothetical protein